MISTTAKIKVKYTYEPVTGSLTSEQIKEQVRKQTEAAKDAVMQGPLVLENINMDADNRTLFELVQNPVYWKEPTIPAKVKTKAEANRLADAIIYFVGGAETYQTMEGYLVRSKGYYHYIEA